MRASLFVALALISLTFPRLSISISSSLLSVSLCLVGQHVLPCLHINCCLAVSRNHSQLGLIRPVSVFVWMCVCVCVRVCIWVCVCVHQARVIPPLSLMSRLVQGSGLSSVRCFTLGWYAGVCSFPRIASVSCVMTKAGLLENVDSLMYVLLLRGLWYLL